VIVSGLCPEKERTIDHNHSGSGLGRPRRSSRTTLQDAALELFLEQGYARVSVEQITTRAGVSRATFFNYFSAKSDLLWADLDPALDAAPALALALPVGLDALEATTALLAGVAERIPAAPAVLVEREVIGASDAVLEAGLPRLLALERILRRLALSRSAAAPALVETFTAGVLAACAVTGRRWLDAGAGRGSAVSYLNALEPLLSGYRDVLPPIGTPRSG
jgi:AcrR family transcriptional regulator